MSEWLLSGDYAMAPMNVPATMLALMLAFICGQVIAWVYIWTHAGLSYSRAFVNSLVLIPVLVGLVMLVLSNSLVTAFGMMAVFAIVRFRNILRDTMDTAYVLSVIVLGMACGTQRFTSAVAGLVLIATILCYLRFTAFGTRHRFDQVLNLHWGPGLTELAPLDRVLRRHSSKFNCVNQRIAKEGDPAADLTYRLLLRNPARAAEMVLEVKALQGASHVSSLKAEDESEL